MWFWSWRAMGDYRECENTGENLHNDCTDEDERQLGTREEERLKGNKELYNASYAAILVPGNRSLLYHSGIMQPLDCTKLYYISTLHASPIALVTSPQGSTNEKSYTKSNSPLKPSHPPHFRMPKNLLPQIH
jgi:hypothetical protein